MCLALLALAPGAAPKPSGRVAPMPSAGPAVGAVSGSIALTIYNDDLALVKDRRMLSFPDGRGAIRFTDVAAQIDPTSVHFGTADHPDAARVLEQNFQYDLVSTDKLLQRYVDATLELATKDGKVHSGTLMSFDGGSLVLREGDGLISLDRTQIQEIRYPRLPGGLITRPTLEWLVESSGGTHPAELRYLTHGIGWHAEYVAVANAADDRINLAGWVSIDNHSGATYPDASLKLVAGDVHRVQPPVRGRGMPGTEEISMASKAAPQFDEESFFEYHLYTLTRPATVADREIKQLALFPNAELRARKVFTFDGERDPRRVRVTLEARNSQSEGLGIPLPKGKVRVYQEDASRSLQFAGEDEIGHTPKDEDIRLYVGNAFDIVGERKPTDRKQISERTVEQSYEIRVRNHKKEAVRVVVVEHAYGDWTVVRSTPDFRKKDANTLEFQVDVPRDGESVVTYTLRQTW